mmetsp:Transcript_7809/g.21419  ORF Transcript_7809/g.21419 Transcript_7809/m.21419 type:complete len:200 (-) Transcript_7809:1307-1906(-)
MIPEASHLLKISLQHEFDPDLQLLLHLLTAPLLCEANLTVTTLHHFEIRHTGVRRLQDFRCAVLPDVDEHVGVVNARTRGRLRVVVFPRCPVEIVPHAQVVPTVVVLDGCILAARCHSVVVELKPLPLQSGPDVHVVVSAVDATAVNHHSVQQVGPSIRCEGAEVQTPSEFEARIQLDHVHLLQVKVETFQLKVQHGRK